MVQVTALSKEDAEICPIRQVLSQVMGKWQMLIVFALRDGALRFSKLKRTLGDVTQRVLTENLRKLERDGYLTRTVDPGPPIAVSYELTELGQELLRHLLSFADWAASRHESVMLCRQNYEAD